MTKLIPVSILEAIAVLLSNRRTHPLNCPSHNPEILKKEKKKKRKEEKIRRLECVIPVWKEADNEKNLVCASCLLQK
ncbi:hypothetical protein L484_023061 [Morus notabilis]|uniref:Uncharacterized protein n=1 Tax=Morus notabilis TaxID=981085 RepID=W9RLJ4_9ROSA|nr:hypothetical protein L484_023061 [Morus notabilis]